MSAPEITPARMRELLANAEDYERERRLDALTYDGTLGLALLRTLAAREALLRNALPIVEEAARTAEFVHDAEFARALAAEIAAALNTEQDNG